MTKRLLLFLAVEAMLLAVAFLADRWHKDTQRPEHYALAVSGYLERQEQLARDWVQSQGALLDKTLAVGSVLSAGDLGPALDQQAKQDFTLLVLRGDSLVLWTNNAVLPSKQELSRLQSAAGQRQLVRLALGYYAAYREPYRQATLLVLTPLRYSLDAQNPSPQSLFPAGAHIPAEVQISTTETEYPVVAGEQTLCWLSFAGSTGAAAADWLLWLKLLAWVVFGGLLLIALQRSAKWLGERRGFALGIAFPAAAVAAFCGANIVGNFTGQAFCGLPLYAGHCHADQKGLSPADLVLYGALLLWLFNFIRHRLKFQGVTGLPMPTRIALATVLFALIMASVPLSAAVFRVFVFQPDLHLDFNNLLNVNASVPLLLAGLVLLLTALFWLNHLLAQTVQQMRIPARMRFTALGIAGVLAVALCFVVDLQLSALALAAFAILYAVVLDVFVDSEAPGFGWLVFWLLLISLFASQLLYQYNKLKDQSLRQSYAEALADERDALCAEPLLHTLYSAMATDADLPLLLKPWPFKPAADSLRNYLNNKVFEQNYLFQHYRLRVFGFDRDQQPLLLDQTQNREFVVTQNWDRAEAIGSENDAIRYRENEEGLGRYMFHFRINRMGDPNHPADIYCFFDHEYPKNTRVYSALFFNQPYKNLDRLSEYDYSIWKNNRLVVEKGPRNPALANLQLDKGQSMELVSASPARVDAVQSGANGNTVVSVGRGTGGWLNPMYLFSILFAFSSLILFALALLNSKLRLLPDYLQHILSVRGSLAKRIHYSNVILIVVAFLIIGWLSYRQFSQSANQSERAGLDYRSTAIVTHLRAELGDLSAGSDSMRSTLPATIAPFANSLSIDANLYAPDGSMTFTTRDDLRHLGVLPEKMSPQALITLANTRQGEILVAEKTAGFDYFTKYQPVLNNQNQLMAYLGVPYNFAERQIGPEVSEFVGILASLYVFLLLIAAAVTLFLANTIIKPVKLIGEKIHQLRLEDKNEQLQYAGDSQDELSDLIREYNRMVDKLEDSKYQLIRLEREGAWREMARQVAHDIKNPLTTMKLSMQQLERVSSDPSQAAAYLKKAITRLIEQIDSLAQIASEFSMFANLDIREKHDMVLNEVVESVYDLFSEQKELTHELQLPAERMHILGDKNHLLRVFNNLVINAMQAIPSDRKGHISVLMRREGSKAIVQISDNGGGIPPEIRDRVFEPNFTTKTSGSGLGLAICRKIIEALDGTIRFQTRENEGTDFFVELPVTSVEPG
ncbi:MAG: HAMP domain-containing histidine kinase [Saprospiraceae bacterium]|nr:HAMP domain-containing histidine kinase [Saprospiraceae bacterium]